MLVSISIIGILAAILIPAIQAAREAARKTQCQSNLRQSVIALHAFHTSRNRLPSRFNGAAAVSYPIGYSDLFCMHSWRTALLPYIEQVALHDSIDWNFFATDPKNALVATSVVSSYICPSGAPPSTSTGQVPRRERLGEKYQAVRSDYDALAGMWVIFGTPPVGTRDGSTKYVRWGVWDWPTFDNETIDGNLTNYRSGKFDEVSDGLSNTIMLVERGGRPLHLVNGHPKVTTDNPNADYGGQIGWSASEPFYYNIHFRNVGINNDNELGIYSLHTGGANVALADGSVAFLSDSTDIATLAKMIGRSDGEY